jgi:DNA-binding MarR family transcriptional regulator
LDVQGIIDRNTDKNDRRIKIVRLNSKGEKLRTQILKDLKQAELLDLEKLSDSEVKSLIQIIKKLTS